jgi:hypothetical protein
MNPVMQRISILKPARRRLTRRRQIAAAWLRRTIRPMPPWLTGARASAMASFAFVDKLLVACPQCAGARLLSGLFRPLQQWTTWPQRKLMRHRGQIVRIGRLALIGYSAVAIVLTLWVVANSWTHSTPFAGTVSMPGATNQEVDHARASRTAYGVPVRR